MIEVGHFSYMSPIDYWSQAPRPVNHLPVFAPLLANEAKSVKLY